MLILGRQYGQSIFVGENIVITIGEIRPGGNVTVMIDAPQEVRIVRGELLDGTKGIGGVRFSETNPRPEGMGNGLAGGRGTAAPGGRPGSQIEIAHGVDVS